MTARLLAVAVAGGGWRRGDGTVVRQLSTGGSAVVPQAVTFTVGFVGMGPKVVDWEYVSELGKRIERSANETMPQASRLAAEAQEAMMGAGQGGGMFVVASFFFGSEYVEQSFQIKQEISAELNDAAQATSRNWEATEERNTFREGE